MEAYKMLWDVVGTRQNVLINVHSPDEAALLYYEANAEEEMEGVESGWVFLGGFSCFTRDLAVGRSQLFLVKTPALGVEGGKLSWFLPCHKQSGSSPGHLQQVFFFLIRLLFMQFLFLGIFIFNFTKLFILIVSLFEHFFPFVLIFSSSLCFIY